MSQCGVPCVPAITFVYNDWATRYPEFSGVTPPLAQLYFNEATLYCANKLGPVRTLTALAALLYMLTAHIAALNSPTTVAGRNPNTPVGRVSGATEGSVSAQFTMDVSPGSAQWFNQTKYGAAYWQASLPYRLAYYVPRTYGPASLAQIPWVYPNTGS